MNHLGRCEFCGDHAPVAPIHYRQNTGMLVVRQGKEWAGEACRPCGTRWFWKATIHTFFLGWWGTISFFVTPVFILMNIANVVKVLRLSSASEVNQSALAGQREYALNLLRTKDRATVVDVLGRETGAPRDEVERFVSSLSA